MPIFANDTLVTEDNIDLIFNSPLVPIDQDRYNQIDPAHSVTLLQHENAFAKKSEGLPFPTVIVTKGLETCVFIVFTPENDSSMWFSSHMDMTKRFQWDEYLAKFPEDTAIDVFVAGAYCADSPFSKITFENMIKELNRFNHRFNIKGQNLGKANEMDEIGCFQSISDRVIDFANSLYRLLFEEPLPQELRAWTFDPTILKEGVNQAFEGALAELLDAHAKKSSEPSEIKNLKNKLETIFKQHKARIRDGFDYEVFCGFLLVLHQKLEDVRNSMLDAGRVIYAKSKEEFARNLKTFFSARLGYDVFRFVLAKSNQQLPDFYNSIGYDIDAKKLVPVSTLFPIGEYRERRRMKIYETDLETPYHLAYDNEKNGYQNPTLSLNFVEFLKECALHFPEIWSKPPEHIQNKINSHFPYCDANNRGILYSIFHSINADPSLIEEEKVNENDNSTKPPSKMRGGFFAGKKLQPPRGENHILYLNRATGQKFTRVENGKQINAVCNIQEIEEMKTLCQELTAIEIDFQIEWVDADYKITIANITQYTTQLNAAIKPNTMKTTNKMG